MEKSAVIQDVLDRLRQRFGSAAFEVVDWWPVDPDTIGIALPGCTEPILCIMTSGKAPGRYDLQYGSKLYADCLEQGLDWFVRQVLQEDIHRNPEAKSDDPIRSDLHEFPARRRPRRR
ncbi:MAG: hypothetical protein U0794_05655 [Isosphaeraceae bacterium]